MKFSKARALAMVGGVAACGATVALAEMADRPQGIKIGERLTLKPYVSFDFTFDSNPDQQPDAENNTCWFINPHLDLTYRSERFNADVGMFYGYRAYSEYTRQESGSDYGENVRLAWTTSARDEKGWTVLLNERFQKVTEDDDMQNDNGRGLWRDRVEFNIDGAVERRFTDKVHGNVNASYYYLDYDNDGAKYMNLYGWQRMVIGAELGYALSTWTDLLIAGSYQGYTQDCADDLSDQAQYYGTQHRYARESDGYTIQGGLQSFATERITYRLLAGWSRFSFADVYEDDGFTYSASANWKITDTWNTMLLAQSYYQPSEREYGSANRVDSVSWGLSHTMIRGKLRGTLDAAYRRETRSCTDASAWDYDEDIFSFRLGFDYTVNRFLALFLRGEYQKAMFDGDLGGIDRDYDRFRATLGFRLQY